VVLRPHLSMSLPSSTIESGGALREGQPVGDRRQTGPALGAGDPRAEKQRSRPQRPRSRSQRPRSRPGGHAPAPEATLPPQRPRSRRKGAAPAGIRVEQLLHFSESFRMRARIRRGHSRARADARAWRWNRTCKTCNGLRAVCSDAPVRRGGRPRVSFALRGFTFFTEDGCKQNAQ
jgi:hypothetical protein